MLFDSLYKRITKKGLMAFISAVFILGQIFNYFVPHKLFQVNQLILLSMLVAQFGVIREIKKKEEYIKKCISEKNELEVLELFGARVEKLLSTVKSDIASGSLVCLYIMTMFAVGCLEKSITGIYGGILGGVVFYVGLQAYFHYVAILYFASGLKHVQIREYSFYFPASTDWIRNLVYVLNYIKKWFISLGLMYGIIYVINLPADVIQIGSSNTIVSGNNVLFVITWSISCSCFPFAFTSKPAFYRGCGAQL